MALPRLVVALAAAALAVAAPLPPSPFPPCTTDQQTVKDRLLSPLLAATASRGSAAAKSAAALQSQLRPDGSWPDVNYKDKTRGTWAATTHLNRVEQMAVAVRSPLSPSVNSTALLASANLALEYWLHGHFTNPNW
jgi:chondroitin AC lyase